MSGGARPGSALRIPSLLALFTVCALIEAGRRSSLSSLADADTWWHLSSGLWILHHHMLPHTAIFSQAGEAPWIAASWIYDLKLAIFYQLIGLRAIPVFSIGFKAGLAVITFLLAGGRRGNFWPAVALSLVAQYILGAVPPTPAYASILLFGVELILLLEWRRGERPGLLLWLPPLFLMWANADVYFVYGLVLLVLFLASCGYGFMTSAAKAANEEASFTAALKRSATQNKAPFVIAVSCVLATLITPYFYHPYGVFFSTTFSAANTYLPDSHAPGFRQSQDYLLLLLVMSAFLALGLRRSRDLFLIGLLAISAGLSFYARRDVWLVTLAALAVIGNAANHETVERRPADSGTTEPLRTLPLPSRDLMIAGGLAAVVLVAAAAALLPHSPEALLAKAGQSYPVGASNYIREHRLPQPLFNAFEWGGFLTWYLPEYPVAIDGRIDLYGDDFVIEYSKVMNADARYTDFPAMANARTIVLPASAIMAQALRTLPPFKVAYSDGVAVVLTRNPEDETPLQ